MNLVSKLIFFFLVIALVPLALAGQYAYSQGKQSAEENITNNLTVVTELKANEFERWIDGNLNFLISFAQRPLVRGYSSILTENSLESLNFNVAHNTLVEDHFLPNLTEQDGFIIFSILHPATGEILASSDPELEGKYRESEPFFIHGRSRPFSQNPTYDLARGETTLYASTPIKDDNGSTLGVLVGHLDMRPMSKIMLESTQVLPSEETYLVNKFNIFVTESRFEQNAAFRKAVHNPGVDDCLAGNNGSAVYEDYRGVNVVGVYRWMPEYEMCIITEADQEEALARVRELRNTLLNTGGLVVFGVVIFAVIVAQMITRPVDKLVKGTQQVARGNLETQIQVESKDEIGELAQSFNQMTASLRDSYSETLHNRQILYSLGQAAQRVQRAGTPQEIFHTVGDEVGILGYKVMVFAYDGDCKNLVIPYLQLGGRLLETAESLTGLKADTFQMSVPPESMFQQISASGDARLFDPVDPLIAEILPRGLRPLAGQMARAIHIRQGVLAPLNVQEQPYGFLALAGEDLTAYDLPAVTAFANQVSIALDNAALIEALSRSEAYFRSLIENASDIITILDLQGRIVYESPSVEHILGFLPEELEGTPAFDQIHPEDSPKVLERFAQLSQDPHSYYSVQFRFRHKKGGWRALDGTGKLADGIGGEPVIIVNIRDVTENLAAQQEIESQRAFLESIYQGVELGIFIVDVDPSGALHFAGLNPTHERLTGMKSEDLLGKTPEQLAPHILTKEGAAAVRAHYESCIQTGHMIQYEEDLSIAGQPDWWLTRLTPLKDNQGLIYRLVGTSLPITERKQMEEDLLRARDELELRVVERTAELHESESQLRMSVMNSPFPIMLHAEDGEVILLSDAWAQTSGYTPDEITSIYKWTEFAYGTEKDGIHSYIRKLYDLDQRLHEGEYTIMTRGGEKRIWDFSSSPLGRMPDGRRLVISMAVDVTERVAFEQKLERSNAELEQFAYVASHDLQEPLRMVSSYMQLLERRYKDQLDADALEFIDFAVDGAKRMKQLIEDLLTYSRVNTRGKPFRATDMQMVVDQVLHDMQFTIADHKAQVTSDPLPVIQADAAQLGQLLQNLIGNAIKFKNEHAPEIHIGAQKALGGWMFSVRDNGQGFEMQYSERIFQIFQRLHTRADAPGTGIGLAVCKRIVERHEGQIWAESQPGQGTTFYFTIPFHSQPPVEPSQPG